MKKTILSLTLITMILTGCSTHRSVGSWAVEKALWHKDTKSALQEQSPTQFQASLDKKTLESDKPFPNPQKYIKSKVTETSINL